MLPLSRLLALPLSAVALAHVSPTRSPDGDHRAVSLMQCPQHGGSVHNSIEQRDDQIIHWRVHWSGDDCSIDLRATGEVKFTSDFTDIATIRDAGTLELTEVQGRTTRRLTLRSADGRLVRTWSVNGQDREWNEEGRRWLADILIELDRMSAVGVDYRFPSLMASGGARAVLDEVEKMTGDYARSVYLRRLMDSGKLTAGEYQRVVAIASRDISSDYEMSRILRTVAEQTSLNNDAMRTSYLNAVERMSSDYERSRVLQTILSRSAVSPEVATAAVRTAGKFSSDYERSRVLLAAIDSKALSGNAVIPILETVTISKSDYEKARVLLAVAQNWTLGGDARKAYLRAADTIRSDYENKRVLAALVKQEARY
jgi:hypothetical protein